MGPNSASTEHEIRVVTIDGQTYRASLRVGFDGVEYVGRLWFINAADSQLAFQDHAAGSGTPESES